MADLPVLPPADSTTADSPLTKLSDRQLNKYVVGIWKLLGTGSLDSLILAQRAGFLARNPDNEDPEGLDWNAFDPTQSFRKTVDMQGPVPADATRDDPWSVLPRHLRYYTHEEKMALVREESGSWRIITQTLVNILIISALAAFLQGQIQESIVGPNLTFPISFGLASDSTSGPRYNLSGQEPDIGLTWFSLVNAIPYFSAGVFGTLVSDPVAALYGRRGVLVLAALATLAGTILAYYSSTWEMLCAARVLQGVGIGAKAAVVTVYISEVAPRRLRGRLLVTWQAFVATGIFAGTVSQQAFRDDWRAQLGVPAASAFTLLVLCGMVPQSPRWLVKQGRYIEALRILRQLTDTDLQAFRDLIVMVAQLQVEHELYVAAADTDPSQPRSRSALRRAAFSRYMRRIPNLWRVKRVSRAVRSTCLVMAAQQCSGVNIFAFLATSLFQSSSIGRDPNYWINFGFGLSNALSSIATFFIIDRFAGRRTLIITSLILMFPFLIATGQTMDMMDLSVKQPAVTGLVIVYAIIYSPGAGVIPFLYAAEQFTQEYRELGMSIACSVNFLLAGALAMSVPRYVASSGHGFSHLFGGIAAFDGVAVILLWVFMRSTDDNVDLGDLNLLYSVKTWQWLLYQKEVVVPWGLHKLGRLQFWKSPSPLVEKKSFNHWYVDHAAGGQ